LVGRNADDGASSNTERLRAQWKQLRLRVGIGAVFKLKDAVVNPKTGSKESHPYVVVGGIPPASDPARIAMGRFVQLSCRSSYGAQVNVNDYTDGFAVFSEAGCLPGLDRDGVFGLHCFTVLVSDLLEGEFLGYLPRELADRIAFRASRQLTSSPYPPVGVK
jgi:hypothetical protein